MLTLADEHKKPRISVELIEEILKANNENETKRVLVKIKDEKVPGLWLVYNND